MEHQCQEHPDNISRNLCLSNIISSTLHMITIISYSSQRGKRMALCNGQNSLTLSLRSENVIKRKRLLQWFYAYN